MVLFPRVSLQVVVEAATRTAVMAQATPVRNGKETKVLLTTREAGTNLIGTELTALDESIVITKTKLQPAAC